MSEKKYTDLFLHSLIADGKSKATVKNYGTDLQQFFTFLNGKDLVSVKYADLRDWTNFLSDLQYSASTRSRKISCVKSFFAWMVSMEYISFNPAVSLKCPKAEKKEPHNMGEEAAAKVLSDAIESHGKTAMRDCSILYLAFYCGLRRAEIASINVSDVDLTEQSIVIHGKGNKTAKVYFNENVLPILSEYLLAHRKQFVKGIDSNYLFLSTHGNPISLNAIGNIFSNHFKRCGVKEKGRCCHEGRRVFATTCYKNTGDIYATSMAMRHSNIQTTKGYIAASDEAKRKAANAVHF